MDESNAECDNTVVEAEAIVKNDLENGLDGAGNPGKIITELSSETVHNGIDVACDERQEEVATDMKDVVQSTYFLCLYITNSKTTFLLSSLD